MRYIIFGAGVDGAKALHSLSYNRVACFCDNDISKAGTMVEGIVVINFRQMLEKYRTGQFIIVIASAVYQLEMELQLKQNHVKRYFMFNQRHFKALSRFYPGYSVYGIWQRMSYGESLAAYGVKKYHHIAISNVNAGLPYLLAEIAFQCEAWTVDCIICDDSGSGASYMGVPLVPFEQAVKEIDCLLINEPRTNTAIRDILPYTSPFDVVDLMYVERFVPAFRHPELERFRNIHHGKRCFVIGNGPSLRMDDLNLLNNHQEITFAVNRIYKLFSLTAWRPTYYCVADSNSAPLLENMKSTGYEPSEIFVGDHYHRRRSDDWRGIDANCIHISEDPLAKLHCLPGFSSDITVCTYVGMTVIYDICLQVAAYMGFSEIYIIGVDCDFKGNAMASGSHFIEDYYDEEEKIKYKDIVDQWNPADLEKWTKLAYRKAEVYSRQHGFRIFNATRGGKLEEFERVDFESLF